MALTIHPDLKELIPPLTSEELAQLTTNMQMEGCREPLIVWPQTIEEIMCHACERGMFVLGESGITCDQCGSDIQDEQRGYFGEPDFLWQPEQFIETAILLDGHNRYAICQQYDIPYDLYPLYLPDLAAAKIWIITNQLGRRNLTAENMSYLRGKQYELQKSTHGGDRKSKGNFYPLITAGETADQLAVQHKVSVKTIKNDATYARDVDTVAEKVGPEARQAILARDTKVSRQDVKQLATIAKASPQTAKHLIENVQTAKTPKAATAMVREAVKQMPKPEPSPMPAAPLAPPLTLLIQEPEAKRGLETIAAVDGREMFILHAPTSKPVFNQTNEMVDWASWTWNPVTGCWHGCDYCYARAIANDERMADAYPKQFEPTFHPARLHAPANTPFPKTLTRPADKNVFTCSMADLFGKWVPDDWILQVFERVKIHQEWNFLFLTKFPQRLAQVGELLSGFPPNAWVGCTVDAQARVTTAERAFQQIEASVKWLSVEPMNERLTFRALETFDWLVMGGQSASTYNNTPAKQPEWEWVEHLWQQARKAKVKIYWKENLTIRPKEMPWDETR